MGWGPFRRREIFDRTNGRCSYCDRRLVFGNYGDDGARGAWEVDHKHPRSRGGSDGASNLAPACVPCNRSKSAKSVAGFCKRLGGDGKGELCRSRPKSRSSARECGCSEGLGCAGESAGYLPSGLIPVRLTTGGIEFHASFDPSQQLLAYEGGWWTPSRLATHLTGTQTNGWKRWRDASGRTIDEAHRDASAPAPAPVLAFSGLACPRCAGTLDWGWRYCIHCGAQV